MCIVVYLDAGQVPVISDIIDVYCCVFRCGPGSSDIRGASSSPADPHVLRQ